MLLSKSISPPFDFHSKRLVFILVVNNPYIAFDRWVAVLERGVYYVDGPEWQGDLHRMGGLRHQIDLSICEDVIIVP